MWKTFLLLSIIIQIISSEDCSNPQQTHHSLLTIAQCGNKTIQLHVEGGQSEIKGRVEVCIFGRWGSVSDEGWSDKDAKVVCRQLGYSEDNATALKREHFGPLHQNIRRCTGSEKTLTDCENYNLPKLLAMAQPDVGVHCQPFLLDIPQNVTAVVTITSVVISWRSPSLHQNNALIQYYVVCTASVGINNATYKYRAETETETSTFSVTLSNLLPSTAYKCCVATGAHVPNPTACRSIMTGESAETLVTTSNCSGMGGGLGALVVILVLLLIGAICIIIHLKLQLKIKASDPANERHSRNSLEEGCTQNPSYIVHKVGVTPSHDRNSSTEIRMPHNPSQDVRTVYTEIPLEKSNSSQYSSTGTEGHEYMYATLS